MFASSDKRIPEQVKKDRAGKCLKTFFTDSSHCKCIHDVCPPCMPSRTIKETCYDENGDVTEKGLMKTSRKASKPIQTGLYLLAIIAVGYIVLKK